MTTYRARVEYTAGGGETSFAFNFPYIDEDHVKLYIDGALDLSASVTGVPEAGGTISPSAPIPAGAVIRVTRETSPGTRLVNYQNASTLDEATLDTDSLQAFYLDQESSDTALEALSTAGATTETVEAAEGNALAAQSAAEAAQLAAEEAQADAAASAQSIGDSAEAAEAAAVEARAIALQVQQAVTGQAIYQGTFDASGGSYPDDTDPAEGHLWRVNVAGTLPAGGVLQGDYIFYNGTDWDIWDNTEPQSALQVDDFDGIHVEEPKVGEYDYSLSLPRTRRIETIRAIAGAGTATVELRHGTAGSLIRSMNLSTTVAVDSTPSMTVPTGDRLYIKVTAVSDAANIEVWFGG